MTSHAFAGNAPIFNGLGFFLSTRDEENFRKINDLLKDKLDLRLEQLGSQGENLIQTYQTCRGILQFHLMVPGVPNFDKSEAMGAVLHTENGTPVPCLHGFDLLSSKEASNFRKTEPTLNFSENFKRETSFEPKRVDGLFAG